MNAANFRGDRIRRAVDVTVALTAVLICVPVVGILSLAVLIGLGRPVLFRQERPGRNGVPFTMLKFRTMRPPLHEGESDAVRTPNVGRFLRASSLDELPQLWNILRGDMSLIGPRPTLPEQVARYGERERGRMVVRPGVTGWAQVNGRNAISWNARIELDLWYIGNRTPALDLKILWMTVQRVVRPRDIVGEGGVNPDFVGSDTEPETTTFDAIPEPREDHAPGRARPEVVSSPWRPAAPQSLSRRLADAGVEHAGLARSEARAGDL